MRTHTLLYGGAHKTQSMASPQYYDWINKIAKIKRWNARDMLSDPTYDYEMFYKKYPNEARKMLYMNEDAHFNDIGKTVNHPTFSNESAYSGKINKKHNPAGVIGGSWNKQGNRYTLSNSQLKHNWDVGKTIQYLGEAEDNGVELFFPDGGRPVDNTGTIWGGVLPNINIIGSALNKYKRK